MSDLLQQLKWYVQDFGHYPGNVGPHRHCLHLIRDVYQALKPKKKPGECVHCGRAESKHILMAERLVCPTSLMSTEPAAAPEASPFKTTLCHHGSHQECDASLCGCDCHKPQECPKCHLAKSEHRPGYGAHLCNYYKPEDPKKMFASTVCTQGKHEKCLSPDTCPCDCHKPEDDEVNPVLEAFRNKMRETNAENQAPRHISTCVWDDACIKKPCECWCHKPEPRKHHSQCALDTDHSWHCMADLEDDGTRAEAPAEPDTHSQQERIKAKAMDAFQRRYPNLVAFEPGLADYTSRFFVEGYELGVKASEAIPATATKGNE